MASSGDEQQQQQQHQSFGYITEFLECWIRYFGDHLHHGFYENPVAQLGNASALSEVHLSGQHLSNLARDAAVRMIHELLLWANISDDDLHTPRNILDVGCGLGGVSRCLAKTFGSATVVEGISLEAEEVDMAKTITAAENLSEKVRFMVADALQLPFSDNAYEVVWCMECADHISDKQQLFKELTRVTAPGGRIVLSTICCVEGEASLSESDKEMLKVFSKNVTACPWLPPSGLVGLAQQQGLQAIKCDNWSKHVIPGARIWTLLFQDAIDKGYASGDVMGRNVQGLKYLLQGYEEGLLHYIVFTAIKPSSNSHT